MMTGWKTWAGAAIMIIAAGLKSTAGYEQYGEILLLIGGALGLVGLGHKIEKSGNTINPLLRKEE